MKRWRPSEPSGAGSRGSPRNRANFPAGAAGVVSTLRRWPRSRPLTTTTRRTPRANRPPRPPPSSPPCGFACGGLPDGPSTADYAGTRSNWISRVGCVLRAASADQSLDKLAHAHHAHGARSMFARPERGRRCKETAGGRIVGSPDCSPIRASAGGETEDGIASSASPTGGHRASAYSLVLPEAASVATHGRTGSHA